jgi:hypothetical protein
MGEIRNAHKMLVWRPEVERKVLDVNWRMISKWIIKKHDVMFSSGFWLCPWQVLVNIVMDDRVLYYIENFSISLPAICFWRRALLLEVSYWSTGLYIYRFLFLVFGNTATLKESKREFFQDWFPFPSIFTWSESVNRVSKPNECWI